QSAQEQAIAVKMDAPALACRQLALAPDPKAVDGGPLLGLPPAIDGMSMQIHLQLVHPAVQHLRILAARQVAAHALALREMQRRGAHRERPWRLQERDAFKTLHARLIAEERRDIPEQFLAFRLVQRKMPAAEQDEVAHASLQVHGRGQEQLPPRPLAERKS